MRELALFSLEKTRLLEDFINIYKNLKGVCKEAGSRLFNGARCQAVGTNWNTGCSAWTSGSASLLCRWQSNGALLGVSLPGDLQKPCGHGCGQPAVVGALGQMTSRGAFHHASTILWFCVGLQSENTVNFMWQAYASSFKVIFFSGYCWRNIILIRK